MLLPVSASGLGQGQERRELQQRQGRTFGLGDGVDGQAHEGTLKLGRGQGSGMRGEFKDAASEWKQFDRGSVAGGRVLKFGLKGGDTSRQTSRSKLCHLHLNRGAVRRLSPRAPELNAKIFCNEIAEFAFKSRSKCVAICSTV